MTDSGVDSYGPTVNATRYEEMRMGVSRNVVRVLFSPTVSFFVCGMFASAVLPDG